MSRMIRPALAALLMMAPLAPSVQAQDWRGTPVYGNVRLSAGFTPDPHKLSVTAGGAIDASRVNAEGCIGQIGGNPDYVLNYSADDMPLYVRATSDGDTSLVVRDPLGQWHCNDDTNGLDPEVAFTSPRSGAYAIWVGAISGESVGAELHLSELASDGGSAASIDMSSAATFGEIILRSGFTPDPHQIEMTAGGNIQAAQIDSSCTGFIAASPDYEVTYRDAGSYPLSFTFNGRGDTTLMINAPDGSWHCDDDSAGNNNPRVVFRDAMDGVYDVWVGSYGSDMIGGTLSISEVD